MRPSWRSSSSVPLSARARSSIPVRPRPNRLRKENAPRPCVALGFGPGLVAEAALFV